MQVDAARLESGVGDDECVIDTASEISLVNQMYLSDVRDADEPVLMRGISGGLKKLDKQGYLQGYGDVYAYKKGDGTGVVTNIMSFAELESRHDILYEREKGKFTVRMKDCDAVFARRGKMYVAPLKLRAEAVRAQSLVTTVAEREEGYGKLEVKKAREARTFMRNAGAASEKDGVRLAEDGNIRDVPVTGQDIRRSVAIYGPDPAAVKGKTTKSKAGWLRPDVAVMEQRSTQTLHGDVMHIGRNEYLICVAKPLDLKITTRLDSQTARALGEALQDQISMLRGFGFAVTMLMCDPQSSLRALRGHFPNVAIMPAGAGDGVPVADVAIKNLKNIVRSGQAALPWDLPRSMENDLVSFAVARQNMRRSQASDTPVAPRVKLTGIKPSFRGEFQIGFGEYCEVADTEVLKTKSNNALIDRSISAIALYPVGNPHESWWFMNVKTMKRIQRSSWRQMVTTQLVVDTMNDIALKERRGVAHEPLVRGDDSEGGQEAGGEWPEPTHTPRGNVYMERGGDAADTPPQGEPQHGVREPMNDGEELADGVAEPTTAPQDGVSEEHEEPVDEVGHPDDEPEGLGDEGEDRTAAEAATEEIAADAARTATDAFVEDTDSGGVGNTRRVQPQRRAKDKARGANAGTGQQVRDTYQTARAEIVTGRGMEVKYSLHTMSVKAAVAKHGDDARDAARAELTQLLKTKKAMEPVRRHELTGTQTNKIIRSSMFLKAKFDAMGQFQKIKARLVANGKQQDQELYADVSSPTVALQSVMMLLTIAANKNQKVACIDIGGAFLNAEMKGDVFMELEPALVKLALQVDPALDTYVDGRGKLTVKLTKALYGCRRSSKLWYDKLSGVLEEMGFSRNSVDQCVFNRGDGEERCTLSVYVDDILAFSKDEKQLKGVIDGLTKAFEEVTSEITDDFSYLGMHIKMMDGKVGVTMEGYIDEILREYEIDKGSNAPAALGLFDEDDSDKLPEKERMEFHGAVAKLLYLSMRVKPEMLVAVIYLCTRVNCATATDARKLTTALQYVFHSREEGIILDGAHIGRVTGMIDASFAKHEDGKSHTGLAVMVGDACVMVKSAKQKIVTKDSTEAELVGLSDMMQHVMKCNDFMVEQGLDMGTPELMQDNQSTISLVTVGGGRWRNKYLKCRQAMMKELVDCGDVTVRYLPTGCMIADVLTKALRGALFRQMSGMIRGTAPKPTGCVEPNRGAVSSEGSAGKVAERPFKIGASSGIHWSDRSGHKLAEVFEFQQFEPNTENCWMTNVNYISKLWTVNVK